MYSLIVKHKEQIVIQKDLTDGELSNVKGIGAQWILNAFKDHIGLDISNYRLDEYDNTSKGFIIYIRTKDLERFRNNKLEQLGI